jgi:L-lactate dehydrogenase (cytochrome)
LVEKVWLHLWIDPREFLSIFDFRAPSLSHDRRVLDGAQTNGDLRRAARRALPRTVFDFIDGGAEDEVALRRNRTAFDNLEFKPRMLRDTSRVEMATTILGVPSAAPFALAPTGLTGLIHDDAEPAVARAAASAGVPYPLATMSSVPLEEVAALIPGPKIFQLYMLRDRAVCERLLDRARQAGCTALILTVDSQVSGLRERDLRNGLTIPPTIQPRVLLDGILHPGWSWRFLRGGEISFANLEFAAEGDSLVRYVARQLDTSIDWDALGWLRDIWPGRLAVKGILSTADAREAVARGADAIVVSNHGGRQLGTVVPPIEILPSIVAAVGDETEVLVDSGVRRGADVVKALALGARGCLVGRPYLFGLGAAGEAGVLRSIEILIEEVRRTMVLVGAPGLDQLDPSLLRPVWRGAADLDGQELPRVARPSR